MDISEGGKDCCKVKNGLYVLEGNPIALQRPRFAGHVYDAQKQYKLIAGINLRNQRGNHPLFSGILHMDIQFFMKPPVKTFNKVVGNYHFYKPDIDNLIKMVLDYSNSVLYADDCIIASLNAVKRYDANPRTVIFIQEIDNGR
jgi:Holliday junction resolvase RusA-like endonuclease